ncbi:MAG: hypothetical protein WC319_09905 [Candidatus Paceibacterota bacterium]|jgi:hypothetical protein
MYKLKQNTTENAGNGHSLHPMLANVIYPELEDIRIACQMIANGIDDLTPMFSKEETEQFKRLASKWMFNLRKHKDDVIRGMINELSS